MYNLFLPTRPIILPDYESDNSVLTWNGKVLYISALESDIELVKSYFDSDISDIEIYSVEWFDLYDNAEIMVLRYLELIGMYTED